MKFNFRFNPDISANSIYFQTLNYYHYWIQFFIHELYFIIFKERVYKVISISITITKINTLIFIISIIYKIKKKS